MSFKNAVLNTEVLTRTDNGMKALESTLNHNVDLFFKIGASRGKNINVLFEEAIQEDTDTALRILQWARDVRGGAGERELFRKALLFIEKEYKSILLDTNILSKIPEIGRFDDLLIFTDNEVKSIAFNIVKSALESGNGLAAKWLPRKGPLAAELRNFMGYSPKRYRKTLVELTKVVETQMCAKEFDKINFSHVPSLAMARYSKAFGKHAPNEFSAYKEALAAGSDPKVKINAGAVYPYDIIKTLKYGDNKLADEQWKALPNYIGDASILPLVDVSGSMCCPAGSNPNLQCIDVSVSLGLYCSDKNTGPFKDLWLTFSERSKFKTVTGTLSQKYRQMVGDRDWGMSTNLHSAFNEILRVATANSVNPEDMPQILLIMSDMQFNQCMFNDDSAINMIRRKYEEAGYKVPNVVFWNLNSRDNVPVRFDENGVALVSGFSPAIMQAILGANFDDMTPVGVMHKAIGIDRYNLTKNK